MHFMGVRKSGEGEEKGKEMRKVLLANCGSRYQAASA